jgi:serine-type D-Ala-D-Ala carboxypeptidase/endopeptidase (penicillin-binding protein 4)
MRNFLAGILLLIISQLLSAQEKSLNALVSDTSMLHGSISLSIADASTGAILFQYNQEKSLIPASIMKLVTTSAALELLGPDHTFRTRIGYTGAVSKRGRQLNGDIIITGGGDPALGSARFPDYYRDFTDIWTGKIKDKGIRKIKGRVITDDSYFDFMPVPAKWLWEDAGNYYGAGAYGLSVFDNTYGIHFKTSPDSSRQEITSVDPPECSFRFMNWLVAGGTSDEGYVFAAPYSTNGWLSGSLPVSADDYTLKASIADPPLIMAKVIDHKLRDGGIKISGSPSTARLLQKNPGNSSTLLSEITSPPLRELIIPLNHESINLYAEHLVKELGKQFRHSGTTTAGLDVIRDFLSGAGIDKGGLFLEDGSGLSPLDAVNALTMTRLLCFMKNKGSHYNEFRESLPVAGREGTLKSRFRDPVFEGKMFAKSGSMTRVRSYAGYLTAASGKELVFCIIVNNFEGSSAPVLDRIEEILKETILNN